MCWEIKKNRDKKQALRNFLPYRAGYSEARLRL